MHDIARDAARIRARARIPIPDALILASAVTLGIEHVVAADDRWPRIVKEILPSVTLCHLGDHLLT